MARTPTQVEAVDSNATADSTTPGSSYATIGDSTYYDMAAFSAFSAFVTVLSASGTSPTLDVRIEDSGDSENWVTLVDFAQFTTTGVKVVRVPGPGTSDAKTFGRYVRFRGKTGGTTPSFVYKIDMSKVE